MIKPKVPELLDTLQSEVDVICGHENRPKNTLAELRPLGSEQREAIRSAITRATERLFLLSENGDLATREAVFAVTTISEKARLLSSVRSNLPYDDPESVDALFDNFIPGSPVLFEDAHDEVTTGILACHPDVLLDRNVHNLPQAEVWLMVEQDTGYDVEIGVGVDELKLLRFGTKAINDYIKRLPLPGLVTNVHKGTLKSHARAINFVEAGRILGHFGYQIDVSRAQWIARVTDPKRSLPRRRKSAGGTLTYLSERQRVSK